MARADFLAARWRLIFTGAAQTWFVVNIPATAAGTSETINARSSFRPFSEPLPVPSFLMSQKTDAHLKPRGAQIEPEIRLNPDFISGDCRRPRLPISAPRRDSFGEEFAIARARSPAREARALPRVPCSQKPSGFGQPEHQIHALHRLSAGAFYRV